MTTRIAMLSIESSDQASPRLVQLVGNQRFGNQHVSCPAGQFGSIAANTYTADTQEAADSLAAANLECHYENAEQTATCAEGTTGDPVVVPAGTYSSLVSQEDADAQAVAAAEAALVCVPDEPVDPTIVDVGGTAPFGVPEVFTIAEQDDGKIILAGSFSMVNTVARNRIARVNADQTLDTGFTSPLTDGATDAVWILELAIQADGKIIAVGTFVNGSSHSYIIRLNTDGTVDEAFDPQPNGFVQSVAILASGKILVGGDFTVIAGASKDYVALLNSDGTIDAGFTAAVSVNNSVSSVSVLSDGKFVVCGIFASPPGARDIAAILDADGSLSSDLPLVSSSDSSQPRRVRELASGDIVVCGGISDIGGVACDGLARLDRATAAFGSGFSNPQMGTGVLAFVHDANGFTCAGSFTTIAGNSQSFLGRITTNGVYDGSFAPVLDARVLFIIPANGGGYYIGGDFTLVNGETRNRFAHINPDGTLA